MTANLRDMDRYQCKRLAPSLCRLLEACIEIKTTNGGTFMPLSRNHTHAISEDTFFDGSALPLRSIAKSGRERIDSKQKLEQTIRLDSLKPSRSAQPDQLTNQTGRDTRCN